MALGSPDTGAREDLWPFFVEALNALAEEHGYSVYDSPQFHSVTLTQDGYVGGHEQDYHVKVRSKRG